jgi:hypothetical protein
MVQAQSKFTAANICSRTCLLDERLLLSISIPEAARVRFDPMKNRRHHSDAGGLNELTWRRGVHARHVLHAGVSP